MLTMMMRSSCCLGLYPPTNSNKPSSSISSPLIPTNPPQLSSMRNEACWRRKCVVIGVASCCTIIIGLELKTLLSYHELAVAKEEEEEIMFVMTMSNNNSSLVSVGGGAKWSEKRACLPWRGNSLETVVPENLPRPAARRRYEAVRSTSKTAPPLSAGSIKLRTNGDSCFSM